MSSESLEFLFHPSSIALVGVTTNPKHWTRSILDGLLEFGFEGPLYLVNPKGGEIRGLKVYPSLPSIPHNIEYVVGLVPAPAAPQLVEECATKGVKAMHFCTAGFSEIDEADGIRLEAEVVDRARRHGIRVIGPNCMGLYCPESRISFSALFSKEIGTVAAICQSGGNSNYLIRQGMVRGVRFSKVISYGNACDLNESDFLEYLASDPKTEIIAIYIEGVKDGRRFRQALEKAAKGKTVVLLKGGLTEGGARAAAGHTASLAGSAATWNSLCRQLGVIQVYSMDEMVDMLVTLALMPLPRGRNAVIIGGGGGASVLIADAFEKRGLRVPGLPQEIITKIRQFTPAAGNIFGNPVDYGQTMVFPESVRKTVDILSGWDGTDFLVKFLRIGQSPMPTGSDGELFMDPGVLKDRPASKPVAIVLEPSIFPNEAKGIFAVLQDCVSVGLPVYYSFESAANAINLVLKHHGI